MRSIPRFLLVATVLGACGWLAASERIDPKDQSEIQRAFDRGDYRDARDALLERLFVLKVESSAHSDLRLVVEASEKLGEHSALDALWARALEIYPRNWRVFAAAAETLGGSRHNGYRIAGEFERGPRRQSGAVRVNSELRDRTVRIQWLLAAIERAEGDALAEERSNLWLAVAETLWSHRYAAWRLLALTDLTELPDYEDGWPRYGNQRAAAVEEDGDPVLHAVPEEFEAASNDGERWRFALSEATRLNASLKPRALAHRAEFSRQQFTVASAFGQLNDSTDLDVFDLETLRDDETIAKLATGIRRFTLPPEHHPIALTRAVAMSSNDAYSESAFDQLARLYENRQQFPTAADVLREGIDRHGVGKKRRREKRLKDIIEPRGLFESIGVQCAGEPARVSVRVRNTRRIEFKARKIDQLALARDVREYIASKPQKIDSERIHVDHIVREIVEGRREEYLSKDAIEWATTIESPPNHFSRSVELTTPINEPGAYYIEAELDGDARFATTVWLEDVIAIRKPLREGGAWFAVVDARTGTPIPGAEVEVFSYQAIYKGPNQYDVQSHSLTLETDPNGQSTATTDQMGTHRYLMTTVRTPDGRSTVHGFEMVWRGFRPIDQTQFSRDSYFVLTDRPVYRPAQTVSLHGWQREANYAHDGHAFAGSYSHLVIKSPRDEKVFSSAMDHDDYGGFGGSFELEDGAALGRYAIYIDDSWVGSFQVEEYVKPEFEVTVEAPKDFVKLGDTFEAVIRARYYTGPAVDDAQVHYRVMRTTKVKQPYLPNRWDWLFGLGYAHTGRTPRSYPGADSWGCFAPRWWVTRYEQPELVAETTLPIGSDGTVKVKVDTSATKLLFGDDDHQYQIIAEVRDASRRTLTGSGSVVVARQPFDVYLSTNGGYYRKGDAIDVELAGWTPNGQPVSGSGSLTLSRVVDASGDDNDEVVEEIVQDWPIELDDAGRATQRIEADRTGQFRIEFSLTREGTKRTSASVFRVLGNDTDGPQTGDDFVYDALSVTPRKAEYKVGDIADFLIATRRAQSTAFVFERPENGRYEPPKPLEITAHERVHSLSLSSATDQPNIFIEVVTISDGEVHTVLERVLIPPVDRTIDIDLELSSVDFEPGETATLDVVLKSADGTPVVGQTAITVYDRSLEQIAGPGSTPNIVQHYWKWSRNHWSAGASTIKKWGRTWRFPDEPGFRKLGLFDDLRAAPPRSEAVLESGRAGGRMRKRGAIAGSDSTTSFSSNEDWDDASGILDFGGGSEEGEDDDTANAVAIRSQFADTAFFSAPVLTNSDGRTTVTFTVPDDLTSWRVRSWAVSSGTRVGEASSEFRSRKPVFARLQTPRFLVGGDAVTLSANVHNESEISETLEVSLDVDTDLFAFEEATHRTVVLEPGEATRIDWNCTVSQIVSDLDTKMTLTARGTKYSDALVRTLPIHVRGIERIDSFAGLTSSREPVGSFDVVIPEASDEDSRSLEIRISTSVARELISALPYLIEYPHGCTEQTINRFLPAALTVKTLQDLGLSIEDISTVADSGRPAWQRNVDEPVLTEAKLDAIVADGLERLASMQLSDGGWGWFSGYGEWSNPHTTAVVVRGLLEARSAGIEVPDAMLARGLDWLMNHRKGELARLDLPDASDRHKLRASNTDALVHYVLCTAERPEPGMMNHCFDDRTHMSAYGLALVGLALDSGTDARRDVVVLNLEQYEVVDAENGTRYLNLPAASWWRWWGSETETHAMVVKLFTSARPEVVQEYARYLLTERRHSTRWHSTRDTALVIESLIPTLEQEITAGRSVVDFAIDGDVFAQVELDPSSLLGGGRAVQVPADLLTAGTHRIEIRHQPGGGHWTAAFTAFDRSQKIDRAGLDLRVERRIFRLEPVDATGLVPTSASEPINVRREKYRRVLLGEGATVDSGDLVEVELEIEAKNDFEYIHFADLKAAGFEAVSLQSGYINTGLRAYAEYRDRSVDFFATSVPRGRHSLTYRLRAVTPGSFEALPTLGSAMYAPELRANSTSGRYRVLDDGSEAEEL